MRAALTVVALGATTVRADARTMQQKLEAACAADVARLCPGLTAASDGLKACLLHRRVEARAECLRLLDASE